MDFSVTITQVCFMIATGERLQGLYAYNIPFDNKARIEKYGQIIKNYDSFYRKSWTLSFSVKGMVADWTC